MNDQQDHDMHQNNGTDEAREIQNIEEVNSPCGQTLKIGNNTFSQEEGKKRAYSQAFNNVENNQDFILNTSITIRLNLGGVFAGSNNNSAIKQSDIQQPDFKRQKVSNEQSLEFVSPHTMNQTKSGEQKYDDMMKSALNEALVFNRHVVQMRHQNREHFGLEKLKKIQERNPLHQNHNSFIHCNYQPGQNFLNYLNQLSNQMNGKGSLPHYMSSQHRDIQKMQSYKMGGSFIYPQMPASMQNQNGIMPHDNPSRQMQTFNYFMTQQQKHATSGNNYPPSKVTFGIQNVSRLDSQQPQAQVLQSEFQDSKLGDGQNSREKSIDSPKKDYQHSQFAEKTNLQDQSPDQLQLMNNSKTSNDFVCITCHRGPPFTRKYAKNQCQTCYKKTKKIQKDTEDYYAMGQFMPQQPSQNPYSNPYMHYQSHHSHHNYFNENSSQHQLMNGSAHSFQQQQHKAESYSQHKPHNESGVTSERQNSIAE